ncbi:DUF6318 family protein [Brachybacterium sp. NBEC-018]|uniref:DUF6318 family protein n=1 Tax=Brachybacterium sp. NBEC-018 TaxID=2996004 RepID=UPI002175183A|nr:DUF6318 family protein [Brachybacterium sp. NBEC-018]UVY84041.1 DUF6318 family protein [Brachybacterium sp. NBEC-018]
MTRRLLTASAAAALVLGLAACGDDTGGTITDPPSTIATGASDDGGASDGGGTGASDGGGSTGGVSDDGGSTEAAPDIPAPDPADYPGMDEETDEGAEQAFKYYVDVTIWGFQTGNTETLERSTSDDCEGCQEIIGDIEAHKSAGRYWSSVETEQLRLETIDFDGYNTAVNYGLSVSAHTEPNLETGKSTQRNETLYSFAGGLNWVSDHWELADVSVESDES